LYDTSPTLIPLRRIDSEIIHFGRTNHQPDNADANKSNASRVPKPTELGPPDTIPLHPQTAGRNPDFMLIARPKSTSPQTRA
jgi:hypothetical protein